MPLRAVPRLLLAGLLGLGAACSDDGSGAARAAEHPVVLIGVDGLEPSVVGPLLDEGALPNLARFAERGVVGRLDSMVPTYSPVIWTTIATGQPMEAHGITFFQDEAGNPYTSNAREVPALWNLVSDAGLAVNCVNWWITWPAETVRGNMLSSYAAKSQAHLIWKPGVWETLSEQTWPPALADELRPAMVFSGDTEEIHERLWRAFDKPSAVDAVLEKSVTDLAWTYATDLTTTAVTVELARDEPADLTMAYMALPDVAGHRFWCYHEPEAFEYEVEEPYRSDFANYVRDATIEADRLVGEILAAVPADANVLLLSDHGMHAHNVDQPDTGQSGHHPLAPPGVLAAMGPGIAARGDVLDEPRRGRLGNVMEVAPLVLRLLGLPIPDHWQGARSQGLVAILDPQWAADHRPRYGPSPDADFRPATPSRLPAEDVDRAMLQGYKNLGYTGIEVREEDDGR